MRLPRSLQLRKVWIATWIIFNLALGMLMGVYHQGGIVPAQMHIAASNEEISHAFWWKTYSPPTWLITGLQCLKLFLPVPSSSEPAPDQ